MKHWVVVAFMIFSMDSWSWVVLPWLKTKLPPSTPTYTDLPDRHVTVPLATLNKDVDKRGISVYGLRYSLSFSITPEGRHWREYTRTDYEPEYVVMFQIATKNK